jgi:hypothetical protein
MPTLFQQEEPGFVRTLDATGTKPDPTRECFESSAIHISGTAVTDGNGRWQIDLRPALCFNAGLLEDPSLVATPTFPPDQRPLPVFMTTSWDRPAPGALVLKAQSWDANGNRAPKIPFSWHLRVYSIFVAADRAEGS